LMLTDLRVGLNIYNLHTINFFLIKISKKEI